MWISTLRAISRACFLMVDSSLRILSFAWIFSTSFFASASFLCSQTRVSRFTSSATQLRISLLPSLCLVWLSKTGSLTLMATAPIMPSRTSSAAKVVPA